MELKDVLNLRRSVRKFIDKPIEDDLIDEILKEAFAAPSAANKRPWEFYVVTNKDLLNKLKKASKYSNYDAPLAIIVCGNKDRFLSNDLASYWIQDTSAATENILLRATDLGLASCWIGIYPQIENINNVKNILNLDDNLTPLNIIYIGYPNQDITPLSKYNKDYIHYLK